MTLTLRDVAYSVVGVYRMARFDATGLDLLDRSPAGALKSFWAAALVLPAYAVLLGLRLWEHPGTSSLPWMLLVEGIGYVVSWTAYPLVMMHVAGLLDRADRWPGFVAAYNWSSIVQIAVYLPIIVMAEAGLFPDMIADGLILGATLAILTYQWFIAKTALAVSGGAAILLVMLDLFISAFVTNFTNSML